VHDEIHNIKKPLKPCLLKYFKWLLSHQMQRAGKGLILFSNQYTNDTLEAQKAQCPGPVPWPSENTGIQISRQSHFYLVLFITTIKPFISENKGGSLGVSRPYKGVQSYNRGVQCPS